MKKRTHTLPVHKDNNNKEKTNTRAEKSVFENEK